MTIIHQNTDNESATISQEVIDKINAILDVHEFPKVTAMRQWLENPAHKPEVDKLYNFMDLAQSTPSTDTAIL